MKLLAIVCMALLSVAPLAGQGLSYDAFVERLAQTARLGDEKGYDKAIRENPNHAIAQFRELVRVKLAKPDDADVTDRMRRMQESWQRVFGGATLEKVERWVASQDTSILRKYDQSTHALNTAYGEFWRLKNEGVKTRQTYENLRDTLMQIAESFEYLGERYQAADSWGLIAQVYTIIPEKTMTDRRDAVFAIEQFKHHREQWDMTKDRYYIENVNWMKTEKERIERGEEEQEKRAAAGYDAEVRGTEAYLLPNANEVEKTLPLEFETVTKLKTDMSIQGGPAPLLWPSIEVLDKGPAEMKLFTGAPLFVVRPGSNKFGITLEGGVTEVRKAEFIELEASNRLRRPSEFWLDADRERPYAMWFYLPGAAEQFQGMAQNYTATVKRALVYYKSAASWVAKLDRTEIVLYDDNSNGKLFEEDPYAYGFFVRTLTGNPDDETKLPAFDSMRIGKGPLQPMSEWIRIDGSWYHMRPKDGATKIGLRPVNPEFFKTGKVQVDWEAPRQTELEVLVIQGEGDFKAARFDLSSGDPVEVPAGSYTLQYGRLVNGKGPRMITCDMLPGSAGKIEVAGGATAKLKLGAPFKLDFVRGGSGRDVKISALTIKVVGAAGEVYVHVNGAVPSPEILAARDESGRGAKPIGEFAALADPEVAAQLSSKAGKLGWWASFFPIVEGAKEPTFEFEGFADDGALIGLAEDKNKLFGDLEPIYK